MASLRDALDDLCAISGMTGVWQVLLQTSSGPKIVGGIGINYRGGWRCAVDRRHRGQMPVQKEWPILPRDGMSFEA